MGGTLTSILLHYCRPECWWEESYIGILLGPERTRKCDLEGRNDKRETQVIPQRELRFWLVRCLHGFSVCVLFENCTVDASIFVVSV